MLDFNSETLAKKEAAESFTEVATAIIDAAMEADNQAAKPRDYLGGSRLGEECARMLQYEYTGTPKSRNFPGKILRVFERGHSGEELMIHRLRLAGFEIVTEKQGGGQLGFATARCSQTGRYRIRGHYDGVITKAPEALGLKVPCLWEMKVLNEKSWKALVKHGVRKEKPVYYAQMQVYMAYAELTDAPALFTTENANTGELYFEQVPFDAATAQECSDRGVQIIQATEAGETLPRTYPDEDFFKCKFCDYRARCWELD